MAFIRFKDSDVLLEAAVLPVSDHVTRITTDAAPDLSGFRLYLGDGEEHPLDSGEYEACTTLYRQGNGWYELSNDGSTYTEPVTEEPAEPTEEELEEQERQRKLAEVQGQIDTLKEQITETDYQVIKTYEYSLVGLAAGYDIGALHQERQAIREQINALEAQLAEMGV